MSTAASRASLSFTKHSSFHPFFTLFRPSFSLLCALGYNLSLHQQLMPQLPHLKCTGWRHLVKMLTSGYDALEGGACRNRDRFYTAGVLLFFIRDSTLQLRVRYDFLVFIYNLCLWMPVLSCCVRQRMHLGYVLRRPTFLLTCCCYLRPSVFPKISTRGRIRQQRRHLATTSWDQSSVHGFCWWILGDDSMADGRWLYWIKLMYWQSVLALYRMKRSRPNSRRRQKRL